jgi:hypothetical protein
MYRLLISLLFFISITTTSYAGWTGPSKIVSGPWGNLPDNFGTQDSSLDDKIPYFVGVMPYGELVVVDFVNMRQSIFSQTGNLEAQLIYMLQTDQSGKKFYATSSSKYDVSHVNRYKNNGNFYMGLGPYQLKTPTGEILVTYDERPLELGKVTYFRRAASDNRYKTIVEYEDITYRVVLDKKWQNYVRDQNDYLYFYDSYTTHDPVSDDTTLAWFVAKFDPCGKRIAKFMMPVSEYESLTPEQEDMPVSISNKVRNEYGPPVIGPDGSVYAYKRTPDTYSILKWTWVDDANDPKSDCKK